MFNTLHAMFMAQYTELWNAVDPIAERIRSLGHVAPGSYAEFGKLSSLPDAPTKPPKALEMVRILVEGHEAVARTARGLFALADKASDEPTADLLTQRLTVHEQTPGCCARCSRTERSSGCKPSRPPMPSCRP
jgi:starvation-inducible DNA-binding protein